MKKGDKDVQIWNTFVKEKNTMDEDGCLKPGFLIFLSSNWLF